MPEQEKAKKVELNPWRVGHVASDFSCAAALLVI
jgi:hypothetical protein